MLLIDLFSYGRASTGLGRFSNRDLEPLKVSARTGIAKFF
jgi:hypothetical protein